MDPLIFFYPRGHQKHYLQGHPERPERVEALKEGLEQAGIWAACPTVEPLSADLELLSKVHSLEYLKLLERTRNRGQMLDPDTYATQDSWELALNAAGGALAVVERVWDRRAGSGFALTRPPGHHATRSRAMGFCLINNIAVAAEYLLNEKGAGKVAIVDLDLHHGNGTQDIFWDRSQVCYVSIHQAPFYPGTGALYETGGDAGEGTTLNLPIPALSGDLAYRTLMDKIILPYLDRQAPEMLLVSFGFDTHWRDPLGSMQVSAMCVHGLISSLRQWSHDNCQGRIAVILEGGYDLEAGGACGKAVGAGLLDHPLEDELGPSPHAESGPWSETLREAGNLLDISI